MGIFRMFFGIFTGIVGIFTRSRVIQNFVGFVLMVATLGTGLGFFFYHNPEFAPEPIAQLMRKIPGLENFQSRWNPNFPKQNDPDNNQNTDNQKDEDNTDTAEEINYDFEKKKDFVLPHYKMPGQLIRHQAYTLYYSDTYKQAVFVAYQLTAQETQGSADRKDDRFMPDPKVETTKVIPADYSGSGYDRGHLAPAADFKSSDELMQESFYMSNMSPQAPDLNRGIWRILEEQVRTWAKKDRAIYVLSGPELKPGLPTIGKRNKIPVPQRYFKIILYLQNPKPKAIAFIMPNRGSEESITKFATTIDAVEKMTGLDFFPALPDVMENDLESKINLNDWTWQKPRKMRNN